VTLTIPIGNIQGSVILFEPSTHENISARTIFDPITAIAPSADCRTFAIGYGQNVVKDSYQLTDDPRYLNGSILIATLQPAFTILHTLTTSRAPSRITGLAWHGSSSKQKTDMLATQTADGDLRVWSVPKSSYHEAPTIIRALGRSDIPRAAPCWFSWSKNGRIVQHYDGYAYPISIKGGILED
jgi:WD40 repeat protein